jgi:glycine cleavage system H lipoate-binding protein
VNDDCYGQGWICKIKITDKDSVQNLIAPAEYEIYLKAL